MRKFEKKQVVYTNDELVMMNCDICGVEIAYPENSANDVIIEATDGVYNSRNVYNYTVTTYDVCLTCFKKVVEPFLQSFNCAPMVSHVEA